MASCDYLGRKHQGWRADPFPLHPAEHFAVSKTSTSKKCCCPNTQFSETSSLLCHLLPVVFLAGSVSSRPLLFQLMASHPGLLQARPGKYVIKVVCHKSLSPAQLVGCCWEPGSPGQVSRNGKTSEPFSLSRNLLASSPCALPAAGHAALVSVTHLFLPLIRLDRKPFSSTISMHKKRFGMSPR